MLDIQFIRENRAAVEAAIKHKAAEADLAKLLKVDEERRRLIAELDELRHKRKLLAADRAVDAAPGRQLKAKIADLESRLKPLEEAFQAELYRVPNLPSEDTPIGASEADNKVLYNFGEQPKFDFQPKPHWEMTTFFDEERAVRLSGKRFTFLKGGIVMLQLALIRYGFEVLSDSRRLETILKRHGLRLSAKPFLPVLPPTMMRTRPYLATNRLQPQEVTFKLADDDLWLTGSAEHTLCAYHMGETLAADDLPVRLVGYNTAYRREVGSAGKDTRGIIRQHQFDKLEMESLTTPETGLEEHYFMIAIQQYLMEELELPFRTVLKSTFDMGGPNVRGVDIDAWMPGQDVFCETNSADFLGDYQARGLHTKFVDSQGAKRLVHSNDATVFCQRHLVAILENNQLADGRVRVPKALQTYMNGKEFIR